MNFVPACVFANSMFRVSQANLKSTQVGLEIQQAGAKLKSTQIGPEIQQTGAKMVAEIQEKGAKMGP